MPDMSPTPSALSTLAWTASPRPLPVPDEALAEAFQGTNFGDVDRRKLLEQGVLKAACGQLSGYTLTRIMTRLELITPKGTLTKKGKCLLLAAFYDAKHSG